MRPRLLLISACSCPDEFEFLNLIKWMFSWQIVAACRQQKKVITQWHQIWFAKSFFGNPCDDFIFGCGWIIAYADASFKLG